MATDGVWNSLCYPILSFIFDNELSLLGSKKNSAILVISPMLSLVVDQVLEMRIQGAKASFIPSGPEIVVWLESYMHMIQVSVIIASCFVHLNFS